MARRVRWTGNEEIAETLDVSTARCTRCGGPARVPEDVAAVLIEDGKKVPVVICPACTERLIAEMRQSDG